MSATGKLGAIKWVGLAGIVVVLLGTGHILGRMTGSKPHAAPSSSAAPAEQLSKEGTEAGVAQGPALAAVDRKSVV